MQRQNNAFLAALDLAASKRPWQIDPLL